MKIIYNEYMYVNQAKLLIHFISSCSVDVPPPVSVASVLPPVDDLPPAVNAIKSMPRLLDYFGTTPGLVKQRYVCDVCVYL
jgi:hypothetical protein